MRKWLLHIVGFSLIFLLLDFSYALVLKRIPKQQPDQRLAYLMEGKIQADVLVLGSSRAAHNILAEDLSKQLQVEVFNLGFRGTNITFHLQILKWYLEHHAAPKKIIYIADVPFMFDRKALTYRTDLLLPFVCYNSYRDELIAQKKISPIAYLLNFAKSTYQTSFTRPTVTIENFTTAKGSNPLPVESYKGNGSHYIANKKISKDYLKIQNFRKLQDLCKAKNIELYVVIPPNNESLDVSFVNELQSYCYPTTRFYQYQLNYFTPNHSNFYDVSHLNKKGAGIFTNEVGDFIKLNN